MDSVSKEMNIGPTDAERQNLQLDAGSLSRAVEAFEEDGYVVLEQVVDHGHLDLLKERMDEDSEKLLAAEKWGGAGRQKGHLQQGPPPYDPYLFEDILVNPFAIQISREMLGEGFYCGFYNGNTNTPGSSTQPLHGDGIHLWGEVQTTHPATQLIVNIWPQDASSENGATQIWPRSHMDSRRVTEETEADRRSFAPPIQPTTKKGDLLIRDSRLWHRGVPNPSDEKRQMIAVVYNIVWLARKRTLLFDKSAEAMFEAAGVDGNAEYAEAPFEYLFDMACRRIQPEPMRGV